MSNFLAYSFWLVVVIGLVVQRIRTCLIYLKLTPILKEDKMETALEIEKALISCQCCGHGFWYSPENETQDCEFCGCRNYRHTVMQILKGKVDETERKAFESR